MLLPCQTIMKELDIKDKSKLEQDDRDWACVPVFVRVLDAVSPNKSHQHPFAAKEEIRTIPNRLFYLPDIMAIR